METQVFFRAEEVIYLYLSFFLQATVRLTGSKYILTEQQTIVTLSDEEWVVYLS